MNAVRVKNTRRSRFLKEDTLSCDLFCSWYILSAASAAVVIKQGSHMKNKTLRSHRMKMERMKMSFYQNIIEVFGVFLNTLKKCRCCSVITLLVQFLQAHCAALDQLRN